MPPSEIFLHQLALVFGLTECQIILSQTPHVLGQALVGFVLNR